MIEAAPRGLAAFVAAAVSACAARPPALAGPVSSACPRVVVRAFSPFPMVHGFDAPLFVLYRDGVALYGGLGRDNLAPALRLARLTTPEQSALLDSVKRVLARSPADYRDTSRLELSDEPTFTIDADVDGVHRRETYSGALPPPIRYMETFKRAPDASWLPDSFQVVVHLDSSLARPEFARHAKPWPARWPAFGTTTVSPTDHRDRILSLPFSEFSTLRRLHPEREPWIAVGRQVGLFGYRIPYPCETWWQVDSL